MVLCKDSVCSYLLNYISNTLLNFFKLVLGTELGFSCLGDKKFTVSFTDPQTIRLLAMRSFIHRENYEDFISKL